MEDKEVTLSKMPVSQAGEVIKILGSQRLCLKLSMLGIFKGVKFKKKNQQVMRGPIIVEVGKSQVAIGFGMASKIIVKAE
ncbi:ferrous iron transport protein A [bacterium]|nr:ferrous iron transport protein A [bacterium]MBU1782071.1 ferrous iron transport protein A [bacterium]